MDAFHSGLRTAAHAVIYFILTALVCGATIVTFPAHRTAWLWAAIVCILISIFDEYRKAFILGRHCTWSEAGLNVLGCVLGAGIVWVIYRLFNRARG